MKIVFVETEDDEQPFFVRSLEGHEVEFVDSIDEVPPDAGIVSVFVNSPINAAFLRRHPGLKLVTTRSSTVDHLDLAAATRRGVVLTNVPDYGAATVAEHTFALILGVARKLRHCLQSGGRGRGAAERLRGMELRGKTLGVVGSGRVGLQVIRIAQGFGMDCLAFDVHPDEPMAKRLGFDYVTLDALLRRADIITLHVPLTGRTRRLLNAARLAKCKPGVILINTARGALVDIDALLDGLNSGQIGGVGLDVLEDEEGFDDDSAGRIGAQIVQKIHSMSTPGGDPARREERLRELRSIMRNRQLLGHDNVFFTPHVGFNSVEAIERINLGTVENIRGFIAGTLRREAVVGA
ncbi:MAG: hydroxyacid dehydrogenase [Chthoniobacterales bacterium]|nr:hydroxyacid dehydrogenase [Chthoniobacterales bacterium]